MPRFPYTAREFTFHAKRGQHQQVADLLKAHLTAFVEPDDYYGHSCIRPSLISTPEGVMVTVKLPNGVSKNSVNKMLYAAGVPGASSRRKHTPWLKIKGVYIADDGRIQYNGSQKQLWDLADAGWYDRVFRIGIGRRIKRCVLEVLDENYMGVVDYDTLPDWEKRRHRLRNKIAAAERKASTATV